MAPPLPLAACRDEIVEAALSGPSEGMADFERYPSMAQKAAVLAYRVVNGHACPDGNKRLALILASVFLELNGLEIDAGVEETAHTFRQVAASAAGQYEETLELLAHWFDQTMVPMTENEG